MNSFLLVASIAIVTYCTRLAGFAFQGQRLPSSFERFLSCVPIAAFAALVATGMDIGSPESGTRLLAAIPAALVALYWRKLWLTLVTGMLLYWVSGYVL
jgi:branched-subunit amino acid transport protein